MFSYFQALLLKMCIFKQCYFLLVFTYPTSSLFQSQYVYMYKINLFDGAFIFPLRNHYYDNWKCVFFCFHGSYCQGNKSIHHNQVGYLPKLPLREKCLNTRFFQSAFSCIHSEYREIRTRKNSAFGHFLRCVLQP